MDNSLSDDDWAGLVSRIKNKKCTPFLGAGACVPNIPTAKVIAEKWALEHDYPLKDKPDLARVAQFLSIKKKDSMRPKELIAKEFKDIKPPDFSQPDDPHGLLAALDLPIYITTNYDSFMIDALKESKVSGEFKNPKRDYCHLEEFHQNIEETLEESRNTKPSEKEPLVYHLHGYIGKPESLVLTEEDYLDFQIQLSRDTQLIPASVRNAIAGTSLLFVGYSLEDWNFRVFFRSLISKVGMTKRYSSIGVQLPPGKLTGDQKDEAKKYLNKYFDKIGNTAITIYWGDVREFSKELRQRLE